MKKELMPGATIELISRGQNTMTVRVTLQKGTHIPEHTHVHEQTSYIQTGCLAYHIDGTHRTLHKGNGIVVPPNIVHSCYALEDTVDINTFYPPREDYLKLFEKGEL